MTTTIESAPEKTLTMPDIKVGITAEDEIAQNRKKMVEALRRNQHRQIYGTVGVCSRFCFVGLGELLCQGWNAE